MIYGILSKGISILERIDPSDTGSVPLSGTQIGNRNLLVEIFVDAFVVIKGLGLMVIVIVALISSLKYMLTKNISRFGVTWISILISVIIPAAILGAFPKISGFIMDITKDIASAFR